MNQLSLLPRSILPLAAAAVLAIGVPATAETQPRVLIDAAMPQGEPLAVFVPEGAKAYQAGIVGARLRVLDDHTFTIAGGSLPPIAGRWEKIQNSRSFMVGLWAKTGQIDFTGDVYPMGTDGLAIQYFLQINAPRTDGGEAPAGGSLPPACLWTIEPMGPSTVALNYPPRPGGANETLARVAARSVAVPGTEAGAQPTVLLDVLMTMINEPFGEFVPGSADPYADAAEGAHLRVLADQTFTISGGSLPPIVGRWKAFRTDSSGGFIIGLWAKTDQVNFTGKLFTMGSDEMGIDYFVQINAPRTDGGEAPAGGSLPATCLWILQPVAWS